MDQPKLDGLDIKPQFVNRFHVVVNGDIVRLIMGDVAMDTATMHSAVVMSAHDAIALADLLRRLVEENKLLQQEGKPNTVFN